LADGVAGQPMNRFALQENTPLVGSKLSGNEIEQGGFSRTIRTDEPGNLALLDGAVYLMQGQQPAEAFCYATDLKHLHRLPVSVTAVKVPKRRGTLAGFGTVGNSHLRHFQLWQA